MSPVPGRPVHPPALELLARCFPAYYGITGLREALLGGDGWSEIGPDVAPSVNIVAVATSADRRDAVR